MAGNENSGGYRPTAPQNNPANINALGGNGQSGMTTDYSGFAYGKNKEINEQRQAAPMAGQASARTETPVRTNVMPALVPLDAETQRPDEPITAGVDMGPGPGSEVLNLPQAGFMQGPDTGIAAIRALYTQDPNNQDLKRMLEFIDTGGNV